LIFNLFGKIALNSQEVIDELDSVEQQTETTSKGMLDNFTGVEKGILKLGGAFGLAIGALAVGALVGGAKSALTMRDAMLDYQVATGASLEESEKFSEDLQELYFQNTDSVEELSGAVIMMERQFGDLGDEMVDQTQKFLDFAKVADVDTESAIRAVSDAMSIMNLDLDDAEDLMDKLFVASQQTGAEADRLANTVAITSSSFKGMGIEMDEQIALLAEFDAAGLSGDRVMRMMNRTIDAISDDTGKFAEEFEILGIEVDETGKPIADADDIFRDLMQTMADGELTTEELISAQEIFGERSVPGMQKALDGLDLDEMIDGVQNSTGAVEDASEAFDKTWGEAIELFRRQVWDRMVMAMGDFFIPLIIQIVDLMEQFAPVVGDTMATVGRALANVTRVGLDLMTRFFTPIWESVRDNVIPQFVRMGEIIRGLEPIATPIFKTISTVLGTLIGFVANVLARFIALEGFLPALAVVVGAVLIPILVTLITTLWGVVAAKLAVLALPIAIIAGLVLLAVAIDWLIDNWRELLDWILEFISDAWSAFGKWIADMLGRFGEFVSEIISDVASWLSNMWKSITGFFANIITAVVDWGKDLISDFRDTFNNAMGILRGLPAQARRAAGRLMTAFTDGIKDGIKKVTGAVSDVAGKVGGFLFGRSPAEEGELSEIDVGAENLLDSYEDGLERSGEGVIDVAENIARRIREILQFDPAFAIAGDVGMNFGGGFDSAGFGNSPNNEITIEEINVNVPGGDSREISDNLVDNLERALAERLRLRRRGVGS